MRALLLLTTICALAVSGQAMDNGKKDPAQASAENLKMARQMYDEAKKLDEMASKASGEDASVLKEFSKLTFEEAQWLEKSGEAFSKNQIRLGERHQDKAREYCEKRGKMSDKVGKIFQKDCEPKDAKKDHPKEAKKPEQSKSDKLAELEKKQAELEAEKKKLLADDAH